MDRMEVVRFVKGSEWGEVGEGVQELRRYEFGTGVIRSAMDHAMPHGEQSIRAEKGFRTLHDG
jgi:hypothetical protein